MKRVRWIVTLLSATALVASACSGDGDGTSEEEPREERTGSETEPGEPVTLDFWVFHEIAGGGFYSTLISEFVAAHPNIDVELTAFPEENYDVKIDTAVAAGEAPDLILIFGPDYPRQGLVLPLDDMIAEKGIDLSTFSPAIMGEGGEYSCGWGGAALLSGVVSGHLGARLQQGHVRCGWDPASAAVAADDP